MEHNVVIRLKGFLFSKYSDYFSGGAILHGVKLENHLNHIWVQYMMEGLLLDVFTFQQI